MKNGAGLRYSVGNDDVIEWVSEGWTQFAAHNDAPELSADAVIGKSIWQFISDIETRELYRLLLARVRTTCVPVEFEFRCDSPNVKRFMSMVVTSDQQRVFFATELVRLKPTTENALLRRTMRVDHDLVKICSWCKKLLISDDHWEETEVALGILGPFSQDTMPMISHGICEACRAEFLKKLHFINYP